MSNKADLINKRYGSLIVKREIDVDLFFCACEPENGEKCRGGAIFGAGSREVTRDQLTGMAITACKACSDYNRRSLNRQRPMPAPAEPVKINMPEPECIGCEMRTVREVIFRRGDKPLVKYVTYRGISPSCPCHGLSADYPIRSIELGSGRRVSSRRKVAGE